MAPVRLALLALLPLASLAQPSDREDFEARWREDIDFLAKGLSARGMTLDLARGPSSRGQKDFDKLYRPATFHPANATL